MAIHLLTLPCIMKLMCRALTYARSVKLPYKPISSGHLQSQDGVVNVFEQPLLDLDIILSTFFKPIFRKAKF